MLRGQRDRRTAVVIAAVAVALWGCADAATAPATSTELVPVAAWSALGAPVV